MPSRAPPNVLLIVLDSVRAASCSLYDAEQETTPFLSDYADRATVYEQARAPSNWTLPSHVSTFTGVPAHRHGVTIDRQLGTDHTVFERLAAEYGYETGLFTGNGFLASHEVGLHRAFETVDGVPETTPEPFSTRRLSPGPDGYYYADRFLDWIDDQEGPWAACVNLMDAHRPYEPRSSHDRWASSEDWAIQADLPVRWEFDFYSGSVPMWYLHSLEALYAGGIRQDDAIARRIVDGLTARDCHDETLVVICGDHGEGLGEPGQLANEPPALGHIVPMQETLLHVPLLVSMPRQVRGRRITEAATLTRFPDAVEAAVAEEAPPVDPGAFVPDGPVLASKHPVTGDLRRRLERVCDPVEPYVAESHAVYTDRPDGGVAKRYHLGKETGRLLVSGSRSIIWSGEPSLEAVTRPFEGDCSGTLTPGTVEEVDPETERHLAALGYY